VCVNVQYTICCEKRQIKISSRILKKPVIASKGYKYFLQRTSFERFEIFTAVTMKNGVFLDVTPCSSCKNRHFGET
jgi:hypothetical protein